MGPGNSRPPGLQSQGIRGAFWVVAAQSVTRSIEAPLLETLVRGGEAEQGAETLPLRSDTRAASSGLSILQHQVVLFL